MSLSGAVVSAAPRVRASIGVPRFLRTAEGGLGGAVFLAILLVAIAGPLFAPHALDQPIGIPGSGPSASSPLGTDYLGRDVLSRLLDGGGSMLALTFASSALTYAIGVSVGLVAGFTRSILDPLLMRSVDVVLTVPALLALLVLIASAGESTFVLILGIAIVLFPGVARIVRAATLEVGAASYIEAAVARGERSPAILFREILPNIAPYVLADLGIRFSGAAILAANVNFLGLGLKPPAANWALMVAENRPIISSNIWSVLAPALLLALLVVSVNLMSDAYARTRTRSRAT